jgi:hypothetical protein
VFAIESFFANSFGSVTPDSLFTYVIGVLSMTAGLITLSTLTAIVFARLSSNEAPLRFGRHMCISSMDHGHLFCRFVTADPGQWLNISYGLSLIYDDQIEPELWQRRILPLDLLNSATPPRSPTP